MREARVDWREKIVGFLKHNYIYIIMVGLVILRLVLGYCLGAWYGISETYDDVAMMKGLSVERLTSPDHLALIKDLSFSVFLGFVAIIHLPYTVVLAGFWVLTALTAWFLARKVTKNKWVQLFIFTYVLFLPIAFTSWGGLRVYRNAIIAPCIILTFSLAMMLVIDLVQQEKKKAVWAAILTGVAFSFTYFLKEDGMWLFACMVLVLLICLVIVTRRFLKEKKKDFEIKRIVGWVAICVIPFGIFLIWDNAYRAVDYKFFGVYEINTRTEGELGEFVEKIYKIESPNRDKIIWAPYDAIQAAFEASPTLGKHPELLEEIMTTDWNKGDIVTNPIKYDFLGWVLRSELVDTGMWVSEKQVSDFFGQVNDELDEAFRSGTLKKAQGRFQLVGSVGGYTWEEIAGSNLLEQVGASLMDSIWFTHYEVGFSNGEITYGTKDKEWDYTQANEVLHLGDGINVTDKAERAVGKVIAEIVCWIYRIINTGLVVGAVVFVGWEVGGLVKNWKRRREYIWDHRVELSCAGASVVFFGITLAYSFATAWFFIAPAGEPLLACTFVFYRVGVPALLTLSLLAAVVGMANIEKKERKEGRKKKVAL